MTVVVTDDCIACTLCAEICPGVFELLQATETDRGRVFAVPPEWEPALLLAVETCPVEAIRIED